MTPTWNWSIPRTPWPLALLGGVVILDSELPYHFSPFAHGLLTGLTVCLAAEMLRARSRWGVLLTALQLLTLTWAGPAAHPERGRWVDMESALLAVFFAVALCVSWWQGRQGRQDLAGVPR
jgi:hypothetical protein